MTANPEYVELLKAVVDCLAGDSQAPLRTATEITTWMRNVSPDRVESALNHGHEALLGRLVRCIIVATHDPRLPDWTADQIADWCRRTQPEYIQAALAHRATAPNR